NILKQNQGDVNDALGYKKKAVMVTSDLLALVAEKMNVSKRKEKVVVSLDFKGSGADDFSELKKIVALLVNAFNQRKFYSKLTNNNLRTSSTSQSANKKQDFVKTDDKKVEKKADEKKRDMSKVKCYNCKKEGHFAKDCKKAKIKDYNYYKTKMLLAKKDIFMAQIEKVLSKSDESSSSGKETIAEIVHMIMPSKDNLYNGRKGIGFENPSYFEKAKDLRPTLYDEKVIGLGYTLMFLTHSNEALEIEKFKRSRENKIKFAYDYGNLNNVILLKIIIDLVDEVVSLLEKEKENLKTIETLKSNGFESSENAIYESENQSENDCHVVEKECDKMENSKVIAPEIFKLSVSQSVSPISMTKTSCDSKNVENKLKRKRRKRKSSKQNDKQVNNDKKKGSSNTSNVDLSAVSLSKLNKNVKRYSRKDLLSCNNSYLRETSSAYTCNDAINVSFNSRMCDLFDDNNFFIFDDESVRISPVSKMPFRKKPCDSMNIVQICLWIIDSGCSKHMTGNHALLTNFVEKFLGTARYGNNDFAVIAGYGDMGLEVAFQKSTCFVQNEDSVNLLTGDRSSNLYTIALNEVASNSLTCLLAKASSLQSWLWHQRLSHLNFATINSLVKKKSCSRSS
nr:hypothetical protein [Tanacetum cinerariifolium]